MLLSEYQLTFPAASVKDNEDAYLWILQKGNDTIDLNQLVLLNVWKKCKNLRLEWAGNFSWGLKFSGPDNSHTCVTGKI